MGSQQQTVKSEAVTPIELAQDRGWPIGQIILGTAICYFTLILFQSSTWISGLGALFMVLFTSLLLRYILLVPKKINYQLTPTGLRIQSFRNQWLWPYKDLQVLTSQGHLGVKISGVSTKGYYSGIFVWTGPETDRVHAIASTSQQGVLVLYQKQYYFLTPADLPHFIQQMNYRVVYERTTVQPKK